MLRELKVRRRLINQASAEGDLAKLKELFRQSSPYLHEENNILKDALFYATRKCNLECVEFLLNEKNASIDLLPKGGYREIVWEIINTKNNQEDRIKMFRFLTDKGLKHIPKMVIDKYIGKRNKEYFKMAFKEFSNEIDLPKLLEENSYGSRMDGRHEFLADIAMEIRSAKINNILS